MPDIDRRHYPRLHGQVLWRSAGLRGPHRPVIDASPNGVLVHSDELVPIGAQIDIDLLIPGELWIRLPARVVRVGILPPSGSAFCYVALQFLGVTEAERTWLADRLCVTPRAPARSETRVKEQHGGEVYDVEHRHEEERSSEPSPRISFAGSPDGDRHVCDQDRDQDDFLHLRAS